MSAKDVRKLTGKRISAKGFTGKKATKKLQKKGKAANKKTLTQAKKLKL